MTRAHNRLVDRLREDGVPEADLFGAARRTLTWHYQYVVLHDYLPETIGEERAADCSREARDISALTAPPLSRWSSPTPLTGSGTVRCATATSSSRAAPPST